MFVLGTIGAIVFIDGEEVWVLPNPTLADRTSPRPHVFFFVPASDVCRVDYEETKRKIANVKRARVVLKLGWRPHRHADLTPCYRGAMLTLVVLAKARPKKRREIICTDDGCRVLLASYPCACLELLPEELLQYIFVFITASPVPAAWNTH